MEVRKDTARPRARATWLLPPALLLASAAGIALVLRAPAAVAGWVLGAALAVVVLWILVSVLWPARADRSCPACGAEALRRLDPRSTRGLACTACGWRDETESAWLLAEEEGPLEDVVLRERGRRPPGGTVDTPPPAD